MAINYRKVALLSTLGVSNRLEMCTHGNQKNGIQYLLKQITAWKKNHLGSWDSWRALERGQGVSSRVIKGNAWWTTEKRKGRCRMEEDIRQDRVVPFKASKQRAVGMNKSQRAIEKSQAILFFYYCCLFEQERGLYAGILTLRLFGNSRIFLCFRDQTLQVPTANWLQK